MTGVVGRAGVPLTGRRRASGDGRIPVWFGPIFGLFGLVFLVIGVAIIRDELRLATDGRETDAIVAALQIERGSGDNPDSYWIAYRAETDGGVVNGRGQVSQGRYVRTAVGDIVRITYLPLDPSTNRLGRAEFQPFPSLLVVGFGVGALLLAVAMTLAAVRARRPAVATSAASTTMRTPAGDAVLRFTRSPVRVVVDLVLAPLGAVAFLGVATVFWSMAGDDPTMLVGVVGFGFFGLLMAAGAVTTVRRGARMTILEVGPGGIWMPELGRLPWSEVQELRLEDGLGGRGTRRQPRGYQRLGIVPRDPSRVAHAPGGLARGLAGGFFRLVRGLAPGTVTPELSGIAPYGVSEYELEQPFADVVALVGRYAPVRDARGTLISQAAGPAPSIERAADPRSSLGPDLTELLAGSGTPFVPPPPQAAAVAPVSGSAAIAPAGATSMDAAPSRPQATFLRREDALAGAIADTGRSAMFVVVPVVVSLVFVGVAAGPGAVEFLVFGLFPVGLATVFVLSGIPAFLEALGRVQLARAEPEVLRVGESGIWMAGVGDLAWSEIAAIHVGTADVVENEGDRPSRPRLEVMPRDPRRLDGRPWAARARDAFLDRRRRLIPWGNRAVRSAAFVIDLDQLDADPDEVIDLIAAYRVVDED